MSYFLTFFWGQSQLSGVPYIIKVVSLDLEPLISLIIRFRAISQTPFLYITNSSLSSPSSIS